MNKTILYMLLIANFTLAKNVYISFLDKDTDNQLGYYNVDPEIKVWQLRNFLFRIYSLNQKQYVFTKDSAEGYKPLDINSKIAAYGEKADNTVQFFIIPKSAAQ